MMAQGHDPGGNQMRTKILRRLGLALAAAGALMTMQAGAQEKPADFPQRPINLVVMYPAGGAVDVTARTFAQLAEEKMGVSIRVENRVGGAGMVGHTSLAKNTEADGYTVGVVANPFLYTDILLKDAPFTIEEFEPINEISFDPVVWVVNANSEIGDMSFDQIVEHAKDNQLQVGMNPNSVFLFVSEFIERAKDLDFNYIPFDGGKQGVVALLAGDVDATASFYSEIEQYVQSGDLKPVAVTGDDRHPMLPRHADAFGAGRARRRPGLGRDPDLHPSSRRAGRPQGVSRSRLPRRPGIRRGGSCLQGSRSDVDACRWRGRPGAVSGILRHAEGIPDRDGPHLPVRLAILRNGGRRADRRPPACAGGRGCASLFVAC
jgi:tripartite-type tricarboxylate transporter receptor subunit TctC